MPSQNLAVFDFVFHGNKTTAPEIIMMLKEYAKKWCFQGERGELNGYLHFQGRMSLIKRSSLAKLRIMLNDYKEWIAYLEPTSTEEHRKQAFYCLKKSTRVDGPWRDDDESNHPKYLPIQLRNVTLRPYQLQIYLNELFHLRMMNLIYDPTGCMGKSTIALLAALQKGYMYVPMINDYKTLMQYVCDYSPKDPSKFPKSILIDIPRALKQDKLRDVYAAIETIKTGFVFDTRYKATQKIVDSPNIWVFTNTIPKMSYLSADRWNILEIDKKYKFKQHYAESDSETESSDSSEE